MKAQLKTLGAVFFAEDLWLGAVLILSCFFYPVAGLCATLAVLGAWALSKQLRPESVSRFPELLNAGLWGLFLGSVLPLSPRTVLLALGGGAFLAGLCLELKKHLERRGFSGMLLSLPFSLAVGLSAWILPDALPEFGRPAGEPFAILLPSFFQSLSVVTFSARWELGVLLFLLILRRSPWLAALAVAGFSAGWLGEGLILHNGFLLPPFFSGLNYILLAMALGGGLLPPDRFTPWRVTGGVAVAVVLQLMAERFLGGYSWLTVTLSFNFLALLMFYGNATERLHPDWLNFRLSPEERWDLRRYRSTRYPIVPYDIHLPVLGKWQVYQGEQGAWTHKFAWQHAVDFVLTDANDARHSGSGQAVEEYYAWNKTVVSPISGVVETVVAGLPDQPIGQVETEHNWGNYVIIREPRGFRVLIAHLKSQSLQVVVGQSVERGQWIARCGNSGYSPEPHVHLHVQQGAFPGEATLPFRIAGMSIDGFLPAPRMPETGEEVEAREFCPFLSSASSYMLGQELCFVNESGEERNYTIQMAADGSFRLGDEKNALYFGRREERFIFYSVEGKDELLNELFRTFPSVPLYAKPGDTWEDVLPVETEAYKLKRGILPKVRLERISETVIRSISEENKISKIILSDTHGIVKVKTPKGNWSLKSDIGLPACDQERSECLS